MKDYSKSLEERRVFILSYEIKDEQIIINLAKGEPYPIPYTEENLKKVDEKMKAQVKRATGKRKRNFISVFGSARRSVIFPLCLLLDIILMELLQNTLIYYLVAFGANFSVCLLLRGIERIVIRNSKKADLEKSIFFMENEDTINKHLSNTNALNGLSEKTIAKIEEVKAKSKSFKLNDIDNLTYDELVKLRDNINRIMSFGFDEGTATVGQGHQKTYGINEEYK